MSNFHQGPQLGCNQKWHQQSVPLLGVQQHGFQNKLLQKGGIQYCLIKHQYNVLLLLYTVLIELLHFLRSVIDKKAKLVQMEEFHEKTKSETTEFVIYHKTALVFYGYQLSYNDNIFIVSIGFFAHHLRFLNVYTLLKNEHGENSYNISGHLIRMGRLRRLSDMNHKNLYTILWTVYTLGIQIVDFYQKFHKLIY